MLNHLEPALLQRAAVWKDEEIERAFLEFVAPTGEDQGTRERTERLLNSLVGAAEFKPRADLAGLTTLRYAHLSGSVGSWATPEVRLTSRHKPRE